MTSHRPLTVLALAPALLCLAGTAASAQDRVPVPVASEPAPLVAPANPPGVKKLLKQTLADFRRLPSNKTVALMMLGTTFAAAAQPYDQPLTTSLAGSSSRDSVFQPGSVMGGATFQFGATATAYAVGHLTGKPRVAEVASRLLRAQIVSQTVTHGIKMSVKRMRPDGTTRNSFPSGHASVSFASATVLQREFGWKVGIPAYTLASFIGYSRIEHQRHYLTDVVFGAMIGIMAGRTVTMDIGDKKFSLTPVATRGGGGMMFVWDGQR